MEFIKSIKNFHVWNLSCVIRSQDPPLTVIEASAWATFLASSRSYFNYFSIQKLSPLNLILVVLICYDDPSSKD